MNKHQLPDFSGKCLSITLVDDAASHDLYNPRFEYQGERLFIIGTIPENSTESNWMANCEAGIAWNRVTDYVVFNSLEAFQKALAVSESHQNKA